MRRWPAIFKRRAPAPSVDIVEDSSTPAVGGFIDRATDSDGNAIWPDDPDETPSWWFERQAWAMVHGTSLPRYRTRRELDAAIAAVEMAERGFDPMEMSGPFSIEDAASRFLTYLQSHNVRQEYSAAELTDVYAEYCSTQNIVASPIDFVKAALALLPAVSKRKVERKLDGRRTRPVCWIIEPRLAPIKKARTVETDSESTKIVEPIRMAA